MDNIRVKRKRRQQRISLFTNIVFCLITLFALTGCIFLLLKNSVLKNESREALAQLEAFEEQSESYIYTQADLDSYMEEARTEARTQEKEELLSQLKSKMSGGGTAIAMLRDFFPEDVVVYADGEYSFFPIKDNLKKHNYVYDNFRELENGQIEYVDDTEVVLSKKGIDVSKYQGNIDWKRWRRTALRMRSYGPV